MFDLIVFVKLKNLFDSMKLKQISLISFKLIKIHDEQFLFQKIKSFDSLFDLFDSRLITWTIWGQWYSENVGFEWVKVKIYDCKLIDLKKYRKTNLTSSEIVYIENHANLIGDLIELFSSNFFEN